MIDAEGWVPLWLCGSSAELPQRLGQSPAPPPRLCESEPGERRRPTPVSPDHYRKPQSPMYRPSVAVSGALPRSSAQFRHTWARR